MSPFPNAEDREVREAAAELLWPKISKWLDEQGEKPDRYHDAVVQSLVRSLSDDGYALASNLDDDIMVIPDSELVHILDQFEADRRHVLNLAREKWVKDNNWKPTFKVGDLVTRPAHITRTGRVLGTDKIPSVVSYVYEGLGVYLLTNGDKVSPGNGYVIEHVFVEAR